MYRFAWILATTFKRQILIYFLVGHKNSIHIHDKSDSLFTGHTMEIFNSKCKINGVQNYCSVILVSVFCRPRHCRPGVCSSCHYSSQEVTWLVFYFRAAGVISDGAVSNPKFRSYSIAPYAFEKGPRPRVLLI